MVYLKSVIKKLIIGLIVTTVFLVTAELVLRLLPLERWERARSLSNLSIPLFVPGTGEQTGLLVTNPHFKGSVGFQSFTREKRRGVKRIFILGGSAAKGWPGSAEAAFSGYLQRAFDQVAPGRFEIVNVAAMSYGSHRVRDLLYDVVDLDPDLVVVWSGNNEYLEHNSLSPYARTQTLGRLQRILRYSSLYRSIRLALHATVPDWFVQPSADGDLTDLRKAPLVKRGMVGRSVEIDRRVLENYRANLQAMATLTEENGAIFVLCTVPVNLADWAPANLQPRQRDPMAARDWLSLQNNAVTHWLQGRPAEAVSSLEQLLATTPDYALGRYLLADCYRKLGRTEEARREYVAACDLDSRPIRALSSFQEVVRTVATGRNLLLADLQTAFRNGSSGRVPGLTLFLDYVHPNESGRKLAAITVLDKIAPVLDPALDLKQLKRLILADNWLGAHPDSQADFFYATGMTYQNNGDLDLAEQAYLRVLSQKPAFNEALGNLGVICEQRGRLDAAREYYQRAVAADPASYHAINLAKLYYRQNDRRQARIMAEQANRQGYREASLYTLLGDLEAEERNFPQALQYYRQALQSGGPVEILSARIDTVNEAVGGVNGVVRRVPNRAGSSD